jgi:hypothetical protein
VRADVPGAAGYENVADAQFVNLIGSPNCSNAEMSSGEKRPPSIT